VSAYGAGAPSYADAELQRTQLEGRLRVAIGIRDRAQASGHVASAARWARNVDELLDRLNEVRGR
jgi:hypothetical protein